MTDEDRLQSGRMMLISPEQVFYGGLGLARPQDLPQQSLAGVRNHRLMRFARTIATERKKPADRPLMIDTGSERCR